LAGCFVGWLVGWLGVAVDCLAALFIDVNWTGFGKKRELDYTFYGEKTFCFDCLLFGYAVCPCLPFVAIEYRWL
jgi:hypothetical protein